MSANRIGSDPGSSVLFVRLRPLQENESGPATYRLRGCKVVFTREGGWYRVPLDLGDALRSKPSNQMDPDGVKVFQVCSWAEAAEVERREAQAQERRGRVATGEPQPSRAIPASAMSGVEAVGKIKADGGRRIAPSDEDDEGDGEGNDDVAETDDGDGTDDAPAPEVPKGARRPGKRVGPAGD